MDRESIPGREWYCLSPSQQRGPGLLLHPVMGVLLVSLGRNLIAPRLWTGYLNPSPPESTNLDAESWVGEVDRY